MVRNLRDKLMLLWYFLDQHQKMRKPNREPKFSYISIFCLKMSLGIDM